MLFDNLIEFSIHKDLSELEVIKPYPTKKTLPEWFKKIEPHTPEFRNIKGCMPFLDCISAGYTLPLPQDFLIHFNFYNPVEERKDSVYQFSMAEFFNHEDPIKYNLNAMAPQHHSVDQIGGQNTFMAKKNGNNHVIKILNPWKIKTPDGYSCLFLPPMYNEMDYFHIISAIVDTDKFDDWINFPIIINYDKYASFKKIFKQGTPYVQIIPFKREPWKLQINKGIVPHLNHRVNYFTKLYNRYKTLIWNKKKWS
jgi:hypothetical protein